MTTLQRILTSRSALNRALLVAMAILLPLAPATAQLDQLRAGARIRLRAPGAVAGQIEGTIAARRADTLMVSVRGAAPLAVPLESITSAEIYRGRDRSLGAGKGALWGAAFGLALGVVNSGFSDCAPHCGTGEKAAGTAMWGAVGAGVGALVGLASGADRWERLDIPRSRSVAAP